MVFADAIRFTPYLMTKPGASASSSSKTGFKWKWVLGILLFGTLAKLWRSNYNVNLESYMLCSETNNIYTVDEFRPRVECISVRGSCIIDSGNFGMFTSYFDSVKC